MMFYSYFQAVYGTAQTPLQGSDSGQYTYTSVSLAADEYVVGVGLDSGVIGSFMTVCRLSLRTNRYYYGPYGPCANYWCDEVTLQNNFFRFMAGKSGNMVDFLEFHYE